MNRLGIVETVLRDGQQSLLATRLRTEDMLPIAAELDQAGYWAIDCWGGATFDVCLRFLGEDPWERLRRLKQAMPRTPLLMLLRGQNLVGYRPQPDDVVAAFVERAASNGIGVFRIYDAMNDPRNLESSVQAVLRAGQHAQGSMAYSVSPAHPMKLWLETARRMQDMGCHSLCVQDMAGLLKPYVAEELVLRLKETVRIPIAMQCHATTGMATATLLKAVEAGLDLADTAISPMSLGNGLSPTEIITTIFQDTDRATGLRPARLERIAAHFRAVRRKYARFEGTLRGAETRIFQAQVPGGMLSNLENQLRQQGAAHALDAVLAEIPRVREDLGYIILITPMSQAVGVQAMLNVMQGERYKTMTRGTAAILRGEFGATPAPVNPMVQAKVLRAGETPITRRVGDLLAPAMEEAVQKLRQRAAAEQVPLATQVVEDALLVHLFPRAGWRFLRNRNNPAAFETALEERRSGTPWLPPPAESDSEITLCAPLSGVVVQVAVTEGAPVAVNDLLVVLEAMKMEIEIRAPQAGTVIDLVLPESEVHPNAVLCRIRSFLS